MGKCPGLQFSITFSLITCFTHENMFAAFICPGGCLLMHLSIEIIYFYTSLQKSHSECHIF